MQGFDFGAAVAGTWTTDYLLRCKQGKGDAEENPDNHGANRPDRSEIPRIGTLGLTPRRRLLRQLIERQGRKYWLGHLSTCSLCSTPS
jgi:hypothetical protein